MAEPQFKHAAAPIPAQVYTKTRQVTRCTGHQVGLAITASGPRSLTQGALGGMGEGQWVILRSVSSRQELRYRSSPWTHCFSLSIWSH